MKEKKLLVSARRLPDELFTSKMNKMEKYCNSYAINNNHWCYYLTTKYKQQQQQGIYTANRTWIKIKQ